MKNFFAALGLSGLVGIPFILFVHVNLGILFWVMFWIVIHWYLNFPEETKDIL